jgi:hydrogenase expression/formation protein HypC
MCLGVPGKIVDIRDDAGTPMASVDFGGIQRDVCLAYLPDAAIGDYALVHVGFAITKVDEASALETLELIRSIGNLAEELGEEPAEEPAVDVDHLGTGNDDPGAAASRDGAGAGR